MNDVRYREAERQLWASVGSTPIEQRMHLEHTGVMVRVQEVGQGPAVVFVHGTASSGAVWAPLVARLRGFRCLILDRPGCGLSGPLDRKFEARESFATFADTLVIDVLDALRLDSAHVVATSFGGYFALRTAAAHPDRIRRMVQFGWPAGAPIARLPMLMRVGSLPAVGRLLAAVPPNEGVVRAMLRRIGVRQALETGQITQEFLDWYVALLRHTHTMRNELRVAPRFISPRGMDDHVLLSTSLLAKIQTPVYFLWGEDDPFGSADIARQFVQRMSKAELELLPHAGHAVWIDDPDHAAKTTSRFLSLDPPRVSRRGI